MIKKILVAYDSGKKSLKALEIATEIAKNCNAEIYIFTSVKMPEIVSSVAGHDMLRDLEEKSFDYFKSELEEAEEKIRKEGVQVQHVIVQDSPGAAIVRFAEKEKIDLIAMGSRNRGLIEGLILGLGSVSNYVIQNARCPVLITKD
ncbi:universal stress protein [Pelotomaculum propionicicum]|uniref:TRAP-T-associated universal stress protein TeaD n=1 Tax=Pelotomaculum propionicicum TaxID=258475 RepID=A0A4Y7RRG9_9FIRM|nr:universal stress protein [Pelotomaculum propionicicum]NLI13635.1 universal stress protein [Peptococcaceae bacterium]TEB11350.1 TRAP-T-associated universal stress protein TeaD [Pelotomaculum propionicicum]